MTSSPAPMSRASRTSTSASVPFARPFAALAARYGAASRSNAATLGPRMKSAPSSTPSIASRIRGKSGSYCAFTSTSGIGSTAPKSRDTYPAVDQKRHQDQDCGDKRIFDEAEIVVEALVAASGGPAEPGEREGPERRADRRQHRVADERRLENPCRDRDERADHGSDTSHQDRQVLPALEPAFGTFELGMREMEPAPPALEQRPPAVEPDRPAGDRAGEVAERAGERDGHVRPEVRVDPMAEDDDVLAGERP